MTDFFNHAHYNVKFTGMPSCSHPDGITESGKLGVSTISDCQGNVVCTMLDMSLCVCPTTSKILNLARYDVNGGFCQQYSNGSAVVGCWFVDANRLTQVATGYSGYLGKTTTRKTLYTKHPDGCIHIQRFFYEDDQYKLYFEGTLTPR